MASTLAILADGYQVGSVGLWVATLGLAAVLAILYRRLKKRADVLQRSEQRYRRLFEGSVAGIFSSKLDGTILDVNEACATLFGYPSREELLAHNSKEFYFTSADREAFLGHLNSAGGVSTFELKMQRADGTPVWVLENASLIPSASGEPHIEGMLFDITGRRQAEELAHWERHLFRILIDSVPAHIYFKDAKSRFAMLSRSLYAKHKIADAAHAVGKTDFDLFSEEHAQQAFRDEQEIMQTGQPKLSIEEKETWTDGRITWVSTSKFPLRDLEGKIVGTFGISVDVTELKRAADQMREAKELAETASRAKSEFLANMSHEIRTPMNAIIGMTELVLEGELQAEQREYLDMVKGSADSLLTIINDVLDFSKIEAGRFTLDSTEFDLEDALGMTIRMLAPRAQQREIEVGFQISPHVPTALVGDPSRLRQIVTNLVGNAIKFTEKGEVTLSVGLDDRDKESALIHFFVTDTGIGIPPDKQKAIFEPFVQADGSTTRRYGGTGLGLAISTRLVEMLGGRIWVVSTPGVGSTFHFTAHFALQKAAPPKIIRPEVAELEGMRVLVVDDNAVNRRLLDGILRQWGMAPILAESGPLGIAALIENRKAGISIPLVLLDGHMPDMDGFQVAEAIQNNPDLAGQATLMMLTSAGRRGDAARCREMGVGAYLLKPVRQAELLDGILTALGKTEEGRKSQRVVTRHSLREARKKFRILLAEDNAVNQLLAVRLLEKAGHTVVVAGDGRQAVQLAQEQPFDVILMDVQMPQMDGYEATGAIRKSELATGEHRPIIAMTAHAGEEDRKRCLSAGMDGFVTKPIRTDELMKLMEKTVAELSEWPVPPAASEAAVGWEEALVRVDGDQKILAEMARLFLTDGQGLLKEVGEAVARRDGKAIEHAAHKIKGAVAIFGAQTAVEAAAKLEAAGSRGDLSGLDDIYRELDSGITRVLTEIEEHEGIARRPRARAAQTGALPEEAPKRV